MFIPRYFILFEAIINGIVFIVVLFTIAKIWKQPKCPSVDEWIKQLWATGDWQLHHDKAPTHVSYLMQSFLHNIKSPGDSAPLKPKFEAVQLLDFPKTKTTFESEEVPDHQ